LSNEKEAYTLLAVAVGWKPHDDGTFDCLNGNVPVEISTADQQRLRFEPLTVLLVQGGAFHIPPKQAKTPF
jgi:hypothetical protein